MTMCGFPFQKTVESHSEIFANAVAWFVEGLREPEGESGWEGGLLLLF